MCVCVFERDALRCLVCWFPLSLIILNVQGGQLLRECAGATAECLAYLVYDNVMAPDDAATRLELLALKRSEDTTLSKEQMATLSRVRAAWWSSCTC